MYRIKLVFLQLCYFTPCREVGAAVWLAQASPFGLADVFLLGQELGAVPVFQLSPRVCAACGHTRMPKALMVKYQLHLLASRRNPTLMVAELQWEAPGFGSGARPAWPTPSHCQKDALETGRRTQIGRRRSF